MSRAWEDLAFKNPKYRGVLYQNIPEADRYPVLSDLSVPLERFVELRDSPVPIVLNYEPETIALALQRIKAKHPAVGMSVEITRARGPNISDVCFPTGNDDEDDEAAALPHSKADSLYHSIQAYGASISKRGISDDMRNEIEHTLAALEVKAMLSRENKYVPPTEEELAKRPIDVTGLRDAESIEAESAGGNDSEEGDEDESSSQYLSFCSQVPTTQTKDERIKAGWEQR